MVFVNLIVDAFKVILGSLVWTVALAIGGAVVLYAGLRYGYRDPNFWTDFTERVYETFTNDFRVFGLS
jgi:hypothetical protein